MRRCSSFFQLAFCCALLLGHQGTLGVKNAHAALPEAIQIPAKETSTASSSQRNSVHIEPHRAVYKMKTDSVKNGSSVSNVTGKMTFEWNDVCDGWAIQQRIQMRFIYADGTNQDLVSTELTWESKDGKRYNFNIRRTTDGQETERYRGKAAQEDNGALSVVYAAPEEKKIELPAETLFPTAHTKLILQQAALGEKFFSRRVYDGSEETPSDVSAFISPKRAASKEYGPKGKTKKSALLSGDAWPVHLAFFKAGTETGEPDYEMDMNLLSNGVAQYMKVDYGDFSVVGALDELEALQPQNCP